MYMAVYLYLFLLNFHIPQSTRKILWIRMGYGSCLGDFAVDMLDLEMISGCGFED